MQVAYGDGSFRRQLSALAKLDQLVLDDLAIAPIAAPERQDLLELLADRAGIGHIAAPACAFCGVSSQTSVTGPPDIASPVGGQASKSVLPNGGASTGPGSQRY